jgi:sulfonate transport system permease protein
MTTIHPDAAAAIDLLEPRNALTTPPAAVAGRRVPPPVLTDARAIGRSRRPSRVPRGVRRLGGPVLLLVIWQVATSTGIVGPRTLAPPIDVFRAAGELIAAGELQLHLFTSLKRVVVGLALGVAIGSFLAVVSGLFRMGEDLLDSAIQVIRAVPTLGLIPLVIIWFGIGEEPKIFLVAFGTMFPIYINTYAAIRGVDAKLVEAGTTFGLSRRGLVRKVIFPGAVPGFLVGLRFALVGSWLIMIVAEQINSRSGLGYLINEARSWYRTDIIVLGLAIYGLLGVAADGLVRLLERSLLGWRRGFDGA